MNSAVTRIVPPRKSPLAGEVGLACCVILIVASLALLNLSKDNHMVVILKNLIFCGLKNGTHMLIFTLIYILFQ